MKLDIIGVTGTNGKTTTVFLLAEILKAAKGSREVILPVQYSFAGRTIPSEMTTPDNPDLFELSVQMVRAGCDSAVIEVSSQASDQKRTQGVDFDLKVFTNLSQDHLDYHKTMEDYRSAKNPFFSKEQGVPMVINADARLWEKPM